jgi:hypothetical protein
MFVCMYVRAFIPYNLILGPCSATTSTLSLKVCTSPLRGLLPFRCSLFVVYSVSRSLFPFLTWGLPFTFISSHLFLDWYSSVVPKKSYLLHSVLTPPKIPYSICKKRHPPVATVRECVLFWPLWVCWSATRLKPVLPNMSMCVGKLHTQHLCRQKL